MSGQPLIIGVSQIENSLNILRNSATIIDALKCHQGNQTDLLLFPECAITGFTSLVKNTDFKQVDHLLAEIQRQVDTGRTCVFLPSAFKDDEGTYFNSAYYLRPHKKRKHFFKEGLTDSEKKLFSPGINSSRLLRLKGFKIAFLICIEAAHAPWAYLSSTEPPDVILWPGYWDSDGIEHWDETLKKDNLKVYHNSSVWRVPIIQATFSKNEPDVGLGDGPSGRSLVLSSKLALHYQGARRASENFSVVLGKNTSSEIIASAKLTP